MVIRMQTQTPQNTMGWSNILINWDIESQTIDRNEILQFMKQKQQKIIKISYHIECIYPMVPMYQTVPIKSTILLVSTMKV